MAYTIAFAESALKDLIKLPNQTVAKIDLAISKLASNPRPAGCKKLKGYSDLYRIRIGDYRVIYSIQDKIVLVKILEIGHRRDIYN
jgi:mRNA interferase RelE/StbE